MRTIVLRKPATGPHGANLNLERMTIPSPMGEMPASAPMTATPEIFVDDLSDKDRNELEKRDEFLTADPMPLSLIDPVDMQTATDSGFVPTPNASSTEVTWGVKAISADISSFLGKGVSVAVLDTGIDDSHPAFADPNLTIVKRNFTDTSSDDTNGHGTHCAGTIFGRDVQGKRIGVATGVTTAFVGKVLPGGTDALVEAINWAFQNRAMVLSMSLGFDFPRMVQILEHNHGLPEKAAVSRGLRAFRSNIAIFDALLGLNEAQSINGAGTVVVAAAGNEARRSAPQAFTIAASPPASSIGIIAVGALQQAAQGLTVAPFSNTHPQVSAPGVNVVSAQAGTGGLVAMNGTSMACPHVAGLAALYWEDAIASGTLPKASRIAAKLTGRARTQALAPGWSAIDIGDGIPVAPLAVS